MVRILAFQAGGPSSILGMGVKARITQLEEYCSYGCVLHVHISQAKVMGSNPIASTKNKEVKCLICFP